MYFRTRKLKANSIYLKIVSFNMKKQRIKAYQILTVSKPNTATSFSIRK